MSFSWWALCGCGSPRVARARALLARLTESMVWPDSAGEAEPTVSAVR